MTGIVTSASKTLASGGIARTLMIAPSGIGVAADGSLYISDTGRTGIYRILNPLTSPTTSFLNLTTTIGGVNWTGFTANGIDVFFLNPEPVVAAVPEPTTAWLLACSVLARPWRRHRADAPSSII